MKQINNNRTPHTYIKYCGLKTVDDMLCASECTIDYIGLMFYKKSPRFISVEQAKIVLEKVRKQRQVSFFPKIVGVFVDSSFDEIQHAIQYLNLDLVQLYSVYTKHMQFVCPYWSAIRVKAFEDLTYLAKLTQNNNSTAKTTKSLLLQDQSQHNSNSNNVLEAQQILHSHALIIDSYSVSAYGGTGEIFDWNLLKDTAIAKPYFIAGGITVDNIQQALSYKPYGIDISSGIETERGVKDHLLMKQIADLVHAY